MRRFRSLVLALGLTLPTLVLLPLGTLWLWQNGWLLAWAMFAFVFTTFVFLWARTVSATVFTPVESDHTHLKYAASDNATEEAAWSAVRKFAAGLDPNAIQSRGDLIAIATRTIESVAHEFHPRDQTPIWNFTIPELLLLTERVSQRLRPIFIDNVPLSERLSVGQMLRLYEWRSIFDVAENVYDVWRVVRTINPLTAVTHEARERLTKQIVGGLRDDVTRRLVQVIVDEIAAGAIDLYSGRLRVSAPQDVNANASTPPPNDATTPPRTHLKKAWREIGKVARGARALYRQKPGKR